MPFVRRRDRDAARRGERVRTPKPGSRRASATRREDSPTFAEELEATEELYSSLVKHAAALAVIQHATAEDPSYPEEQRGFVESAMADLTHTRGLLGVAAHSNLANAGRDGATAPFKHGPIGELTERTTKGVIACLDEGDAAVCIKELEEPVHSLLRMATTQLYLARMFRGMTA